MPLTVEGPRVSARIHLRKSCILVVRIASSHQLQTRGLDVRVGWVGFGLYSGSACRCYVKQRLSWEPRRGVSFLSVTGNEAMRFQVVRKLQHLDGPDVVDRVQTGGPRSPLRQERQKGTVAERIRPLHAPHFEPTQVRLSLAIQLLKCGLYHGRKLESM